MPMLGWRGAALACAVIALGCGPLSAEEPLPWQRDAGRYAQNTAPDGDPYRPSEPYRREGYTPTDDNYRSSDARADDAYRPPPPRDSYGSSYGSGSTYNNGPPVRDGGGYGEPYPTPRAEPYDRNYGEQPAGPREYYQPGPDREVAGDGSYSQSEILAAGHGFFGSVSKGLASVVEYAFQQSGRPNGYILGEDAGGAIVAGLRYGEGTLYTKDAGQHRVYWQGPSVGYDFGGEGSKTMVLVYNLRDPADIYHRFGGVQGSAYLVGGVSIQFQKYGDVVLAPIRSGIGLRLGANIGYLKYTRAPTWNPF